jgi:hypothetical protein
MGFTACPYITYNCIIVVALYSSFKEANRNACQTMCGDLFSDLLRREITIKTSFPMRVSVSISFRGVGVWISFITLI